MDFGEVLGKAWKIIWKHKVLWIFGIFAGCNRGGGSGGSGGTGWEQSAQSDQSLPSDALSGVQQFFEGLVDWIGSNPWTVALLILVILVLIALAAFLGTVGKIGLIRGTFKADEGAERLSFGELFRESLPFFWRVFLLSFLIGVAFLLVLLPMILIGIVTAGVALLCLAPLFCLLVPLMLAIGVVVQQADAAMVIENLGMVDGVRRGWEVAKKNIGPVLLIWFITAVIGVAVGVLLALPILVTVIPAVVAIAAANGNVSTGVLVVGGLCLVLYLPVLVVAQGILGSYIESVWALTFLRLTRTTESRGPAVALPANA